MTDTNVTDNNIINQHTMIMGMDTSPPSGSGYGNPPKHTQFKKGKSGNPKGRPPKKFFHEVIEYILNEKVTLTVNGEKVEMTRKEAVIYTLVNDSIKGKSPQTRNLMVLLRNMDKTWPV